MSFAVTKTYDDGTDLTESQLDAAFQSIETLVNTTKFSSDNLQNNSVDTAQIASSAVTTAKIAAANVTLSKLAADITALLMPTGAVQAYVGTSAPTGWLICDGSSVSRVTYAALYGVIGTTHGTVDGTTFNIPDYRGRFLRGFDNSAGRDLDAASRTAMNAGGSTGDNIGTVQASAYLSHTHTATVTDPGHVHSLTAGGISGPANVGAGGYGINSSNSPSATTGVTVANANSGGNETRPINASVNYIIKI